MGRALQTLGGCAGEGKQRGAERGLSERGIKGCFVCEMKLSA